MHSIYKFHRGLFGRPCLRTRLRGKAMKQAVYSTLGSSIHGHLAARIVLCCFLWIAVALSAAMAPSYSGALQSTENDCLTFRSAEADGTRGIQDGLSSGLHVTLHMLRMVGRLGKRRLAAGKV